MGSPSSTQGTYPYQNQANWSRSEKAIARRVFDAALKRELQGVIQETKQKASQIKEPTDLWELERYLTQRRKGIDRKYEFRSSQPVRVFGTLLHEGRICEEELRGLGEDKMKAVRSAAKFLSQNVA